MQRVLDIVGSDFQRQIFRVPRPNLRIPSKHIRIGATENQWSKKKVIHPNVQILMYWFLHKFWHVIPDHIFRRSIANTQVWELHKIIMKKKKLQSKIVVLHTLEADVNTWNLQIVPSISRLITDTRNNTGAENELKWYPLLACSSTDFHRKFKSRYSTVLSTLKNYLVTGNTQMLKLLHRYERFWIILGHPQPQWSFA